MLDLPVFQFDRHRPAKNRQLDAHQTLRFKQILDFAFHAGKRSILDLDAIATVVFRFGMSNAGDMLSLASLHALDLPVRHGRRRVIETATDEVADAGSLPEEVKYAVVVFHL